jgi:hypothetical protein
VGTDIVRANDLVTPPQNDISGLFLRLPKSVGNESPLADDYTGDGGRIMRKYLLSGVIPTTPCATIYSRTLGR